MHYQFMVKPTEREYIEYTNFTHSVRPTETQKSEAKIITLSKEFAL